MANLAKAEAMLTQLIMRVLRREEDILAEQQAEERRIFDEEGKRLFSEHIGDFYLLNAQLRALGVPPVPIPTSDPAPGRALPSREDMERVMGILQSNLESALSANGVGDDALNDIE